MFESVNGGKLPTKGTKFSACVDLYANEDVVIGAGETKIVPLGVKIDLNRGILDRYAVSINKKDDGMDFGEYYDDLKYLFMINHKLDLHIRSSLSAKKGLIIANDTGQKDLDYPDEIGIILHNPVGIQKAEIIEHEPNISDWTFDAHTVEVKKGDRVAQITLVEHKSCLLGIDSEDERTGGYGSTDKVLYEYKYVCDSCGKHLHCIEMEEEETVEECYNCSYRQKIKGKISVQ